MKYRLLEKIGSGGMAEVFRAVGEGPAGFERPFAVKRIHPRLSQAPEWSRMFVDEARISARLVHPNIVQVFEFVQQDGGHYIVMEPVDGVDMGRVFRRVAGRHEVLSPLAVAEVARQVCRGLEFAHALGRADGQAVGVVHRDVTPPNIMVDWNGTVKIVDFGIARAMQDLQTHAAEAGTVRGKVSYVAPELLEGRVADGRSDVFSLAVVLHELLSGERLFLGENDLETLKLVRDKPIEPPSARNPAVKAALDAIVMRGLERNPAKRYQSAREMGDELEDFVVRRQFSTRALAEAVRELFPAGAEREADESSVEAAPGPSTIGKPDAIIALEGAAERPRRVTPPPTPPLAARQTATTPPAPLPPPPVQAAPRSASGPIAVPARAGFRLSVAASVALVAVSLSAVLGALFVVVAARGRGSPAGDLAGGSATPAGAGMNVGQSPSGAAPGTVQFTLDSVPQGASVARAGADEAIGQTPLVLSLARGEAPVELVLTKSGFAPLTFHVIANHDKDATAVLEREAPVLVASATTTEETPRPKRKRSSRAGKRSDTLATATAGAPLVAVPDRPAAQAPAPPTTQGARPFGVVPASTLHR